MELGSWELHIFVSLAVILGTAFIALIVDYLKGSNEQLREHNIELRVRTEETERRAILDPMRYAHPSILSALKSAVGAKSRTADRTDAAEAAATVESKRAATREAPATLVPVAVESLQPVITVRETMQPPAAAERAVLGGELLEQVIAATPGQSAGAPAVTRVLYQNVEESAPVRVAETPEPRPAKASWTTLRQQQAEPVAEARTATKLPEADLENPDRVVFVTPVELDAEEQEVQSRPLLHQFEVIGGRRPVISDVPEELTAPIKLRLHSKQVEEPVAPEPIPQAEPTGAAAETSLNNDWTSILYNSNESEAPMPVAEAEAETEPEIEAEIEPEIEAEPADAPKEWFREPDSWRSNLSSFPFNRVQEPVQMDEEPLPAAAVEKSAEWEPVREIAAKVPELMFREQEAPVPSGTVIEPEVLENDEELENLVIYASPQQQTAYAEPAPEVAAPAAFTTDFDIVYAPQVAAPAAESEVPLVASFERVPQNSRFQTIAWPNPVARPDPIIFTEPAVLPKSRLKPEGTEDWTKAEVAAAETAQQQQMPVFAAPRALPIPAGYHDSSVLEGLYRSDGLFSGLVVAIGINDFRRVQDSAGRSGMETLVESVISVVRGCAGDKGFACRSAEDEFLIIHPNEHGPSAQRRLSQVSERLWDFQLRSLGGASIMFSSGSVDVEHERLSDAVAAANERMYQTKRSRKTVAMDTGRQKRAVNA